MVSCGLTPPRPTLSCRFPVAWIGFGPQAPSASRTVPSSSPLSTCLSDPTAWQTMLFTEPDCGSTDAAYLPYRRAPMRHCGRVDAEARRVARLVAVLWGLVSPGLDAGRCNSPRGR